MTLRVPIVKVYCSDGAWQPLTMEEYEATKDQWMSVQITLPYIVSAEALHAALSDKS